MHEGFLKVDDVDPALSAVNKALHFGIPAFGLMTEVKTCIQQVLNRQCRI